MYINPKIKNIEIDYYRMEEDEERGLHHTKDYRGWFFSYEKVRELLAMACEDVIPNGNYGDVECCLWGEMGRILYKEGLKEWDV